MPHSDLHKKKLTKNLIMLAIILGFMVLIWMVTMIKMANAQEDQQILKVDRAAETNLEYRARLSDTNEDGSRKAKQVFDIEESYIETRQAHREAQEDNPERWWYEDLSLHTEDGEQKTGRPLDINRERQLRNTYNQNRGVGGISTTRP